MLYIDILHISCTHTHTLIILKILNLINSFTTQPHSCYSSNFILMVYPHKTVLSLNNPVTSLFSVTSSTIPWNSKNQSAIHTQWEFEKRFRFFVDLSDWWLRTSKNDCGAPQHTKRGSNGTVYDVYLPVYMEAPVHLHYCTWYMSPWW